MRNQLYSERERERERRNNNGAIESFNSSYFIKLSDCLLCILVPYNVLGVELERKQITHVLRDRDTRNNNDAIESFNSNSFIELSDLLALYFSVVPHNVFGEELQTKLRTHHSVISNPDANNLLLIFVVLCCSVHQLIYYTVH
jgi:hypothetical protein